MNNDEHMHTEKNELDSSDDNGKEYARIEEKTGNIGTTDEKESKI